MSASAAIIRRRVFVLIVNALTLVLSVVVLVDLILAGGVTPCEWIIALGFVLTMPFNVLGFWNVLIGLWLRHVRPRVLYAMPGVAELRASGPLPRLECHTVLVMTLRNEAPEPIFERLDRMRESLAATGQSARFCFAILSDTNRPEIIEAERRAFEAFANAHRGGGPRPIYRRRSDNRGYKAGNIAEFLDAHGDDYRYFLTLDSDSLMSGEVIVRMVAIMEARPNVGILQSLVVGMPSVSGFARVFQFGMRHAMRVFTAGAAWWTADCGSYWGHNAVIRTAPFMRHCRLPQLPGAPPFGGDVLSHDQLEAAFMRRAGYEVRVIPVESDSYEINPPTLLDFIRRELRWCQGNMQYLRLLATPGLAPVSRVQLGQAIGMYIAPAAWIGMILAFSVGAVTGGVQMRNPVLGMTLFFGVLTLAIAPRIAGAIDVCLSRRGLVHHGGARLFGISALLELGVSTLIAPIIALSITLFLIGLLFGRSVAWGGQNRDRLGLRWRDAAPVLAPHTLLGLAIGGALWWTHGLSAAAWGLPIIAGLGLALPYTVWSARPAVGARLARRGLFLIPEERRTPNVLADRRAASRADAALVAQENS